MSVAGQSTFRKRNPPENVLKDDTSIWHSHSSRNGDVIPYIALKTEREEKVFMVKVVGCSSKKCKGRYKDVEVRVSSTLSYENAISCGIKSGDGIDGIDVTVHK